MQTLLRKADIDILRTMYEVELHTDFTKAATNIFDDLQQFFVFYYLNGGQAYVMYPSDIASIVARYDELENLGRAWTDTVVVLGPGPDGVGGAIRDRKVLVGCLKELVEQVPRYLGYSAEYSDKKQHLVLDDFFGNEGMGSRPHDKSYVDLVARWRLSIGK